MALSLQPLIRESRMRRPSYPSFRLLLYLEGLLVVMALLMDVLLPFHWSWSLPLRVFAISSFGLMGLRLPDSRLANKVLYTALEFGLIWLATLTGSLSSRSLLLLCLVLVLRSCLVFGRLGQVMVVGLAFFSYGLLQLSRPVDPEKFRAMIWDWRLSAVLQFGLTLVFGLMLINALLAECQSREALEVAHRQLQQYALRIEDQATLQERNRIAREIHDGLGHTLAAQTIQLNNALLYWHSNQPRALDFLKQSKQLGADALLEIRRSISMLRTNPLQGQSLEGAIAKLLADFQQTTGTDLTCSICSPGTLPVEVNTALYRIVQESLTNICKHAHATAVTVDLHHQAGLLHLAIADNGEGFNPTQNTTGFGLQGMRERAEALGGHFQLDSQPAAGCRVLVTLPLSTVQL